MTSISLSYVVHNILKLWPNKVYKQITLHGPGFSKGIGAYAWCHDIHHPAELTVFAMNKVVLHRSASSAVQRQVPAGAYSWATQPYWCMCRLHCWSAHDCRITANANCERQVRGGKWKLREPEALFTMSCKNCWQHMDVSLSVYLDLACIPFAAIIIPDTPFSACKPGIARCAFFAFPADAVAITVECWGELQKHSP